MNRRIIIDYLAQGKGQQHLFKKTARSIVDKLILIAISPCENYKESFDNNKKFLTHTDNKARIVFMVAVNVDFPERIGYKLLSTLETRTSSTIYKNYFIPNENDIAILEKNFENNAKDVQLYMVELERNYRDIASNDKLRVINNSVEEIRVDLNKNIHKVVGNIQLLENLENKSSQLKDLAKQYKNEAKDVKKATRWSRRKTTIVAGGISLGTLVFLGFRFLK